MLRHSNDGGNGGNFRGGRGGDGGRGGGGGRGGYQRQQPHHHHGNQHQGGGGGGGGSDLPTYTGPFPKSLQERLEHQKQSLTRWQKKGGNGDEEWIDARDPIPTILLTRTIEYLYATRPCGAGAVLVFLPGWKEIEDQRKSLERSNLLGKRQQSEGRVLVYTLHSGKSAGYQLSAFDVPEDPSVMKIVLATNIAEVRIVISFFLFFF